MYELSVFNLHLIFITRASVKKKNIRLVYIELMDLDIKETVTVERSSPAVEESA